MLKNRYRKVGFFGVITIKCDVLTNVKSNVKSFKKKVIQIYGSVVGGTRGES